MQKSSEPNSSVKIDNSNQNQSLIKKEKVNNINLDVFKKECENLGFQPKTEKFGECVLRLVEAAKK